MELCNHIDGRISLLNAPYKTMNRIGINLTQKKDNKFTRFLKDADIRLLGLIPPIFAFLLLIVLLKIWGGNPSEKQMAIAGISTAMLVSLTGLVQIYRREAPGIRKSFRGVLAVFSGMFIVALFWLLAIFFTILSALYWYFFLWLFLFLIIYFLLRL